MTSMQRSIGVMALLAMALAPAITSSQQAAPSRFQSRAQFDGKVTLLANGKEAAIAVDYKTWMINAHSNIESLPIGGNGNVIVEVHSGTLTTIIGDQRQPRRTGEFWVLPAGQKMGVVTSDRAVILHTLTVPSQ